MRRVRGHLATLVPTRFDPHYALPISDLKFLAFRRASDRQKLSDSIPAGAAIIAGTFLPVVQAPLRAVIVFAAPRAERIAPAGAGPAVSTPMFKSELGLATGDATMRPNAAKSSTNGSKSPTQPRNPRESFQTRRPYSLNSSRFFAASSSAANAAAAVESKLASRSRTRRTRACKSSSRCSSSFSLSCCA
jgi:hypothetical protein